jgi:hypothetical protein
MIISFKAMDGAPARIVEMNADENRILLPILDRDPAIERNENIARSRHDRAELRFAQFLIHSPRHVEGDNFFRRSGATIRAVVSSAVAGIDHDGSKSASGIFDWPRLFRGATSERTK